MKHYGDITKINGAEISLVDIITGGSPCQDLSVAGRREGLAGERSGLFMEQIRIVKEQRNECIRQLSMHGANEPIRPRYMVWENVVGAFSSNNGEDFRCVLEETAKIADENAVIPELPKGEKWRNAGLILGDGYSIAWRVHDAQYHGVPQRRRRICLLADFNGDTAGKILFELRRETAETDTDKTFMDLGDRSRSEVPLECESLQRNTDESRETGKGTPENAQGNPDKAVRSICIGNGQVHDAMNLHEEVCNTLNCMVDPMKVMSIGDCREAVCVGNGQLMQAKESPLVGALNCMHDQQAIMTYATQACGDRDNSSQSFIEETAYTIPANPMSDRGQAVCVPINTMVASRTNYEKRTTFGVGEDGDPQFTLSAAHEHAVCLGLDRASFNQGKNAQYDFSVEEEMAQTLVSKGPGGVMTRSEHCVQEITKE